MNIQELYSIIDRQQKFIKPIKESNIEQHLEINILKDPNEFIKDNPSTKEITSSIFFDRPGSPNPEGLLSNTIFGITKEERSGIYGYIDLYEYFIHPLIYKKLTRLDRKFRDIVHGTKTFIINSSGELIEDKEKGKTGLKWLKANFDKIKLKSTTSDKRDKVLKFINDNRKNMFMNKLLVMPAYFRDVNTEAKGKVSVGEINELYASIISNVKGIKETSDYGIDVSDAIRGRIQEGILAIYDWICGNTNSLLEGSTGLSKKNGIIRRAGLSKTTDYGGRLVLSAPNMRVEAIDDVMVDITHAAAPLSAVLANFLPFIIYHVKRFIDNEFAGDYPIINKNGKIEYILIDDAPLVFSDEFIKDEIDNFIHGYSNRFKPFTYEKNGKKYTFKFKGRNVSLEQIKAIRDDPNTSDFAIDNSTLIGSRTLTWCDIFYMAAVEATKDKCILITRYPMEYKNVA